MSFACTLVLSELGDARFSSWCRDNFLLIFYPRNYSSKARIILLVFRLPWRDSCSKDLISYLILNKAFLFESVVFRVPFKTQITLLLLALYSTPSPLHFLSILHHSKTNTNDLSTLNKRPIDRPAQPTISSNKNLFPALANSNTARSRQHRLIQSPKQHLHFPFPSSL